MPAGPREVLTQHKCPGSTPHPLSMNQLNRSTEKLTQTHRHPSNHRRSLGGACLVLRLPGTSILAPALRLRSSLSEGNSLALTPRKPRTFWAAPYRLPPLPFVGKPSFRPNGSCLVCPSWIYLLRVDCAVRMLKVWLYQRDAQKDQHRDFALKELRVQGAGRGESDT